ncbi:hypothetical protein HK102_000952, partial [Quaeritorhiza haematococci]
MSLPVITSKKSHPLLDDDDDSDDETEHCYKNDEGIPIKSVHDDAGNNSCDEVGDVSRSSITSVTTITTTPRQSLGSKSRPLLRKHRKGRYTHTELLLAAETLENIVMEGSVGGGAGHNAGDVGGNGGGYFSGSPWGKRFLGFSAGSAEEAKGENGREIGVRVLRLVYGTMKYLTYIDSILVKTQFLVYNTQFLNHLSLVKIMMYDLMKYHFEYQHYPGIQYSDDEGQDQTPSLSVSSSVRSSTTTVASTSSVSTEYLDSNRPSVSSSQSDFSARSSVASTTSISSYSSSLTPQQRISRRNAPASASKFRANDDFGADLVQSLAMSLYSHRTKLSAAFARIRIERKAGGGGAVSGNVPVGTADNRANVKEWMKKILPEEVRMREMIAEQELQRTLSNTPAQQNDEESRTATIPNLPPLMSTPTSTFTSVAAYMSKYVRPKKEKDVVTLERDQDFDDMLVVPSQVFTILKNHPIVTEGRLVCQDKASFFAPHHVHNYLKWKANAGTTSGRNSIADQTQKTVNPAQPIHIIDARAGCGTKLAHLSALMGDVIHVYAFENRVSRLESLKAKLKLQGANNVTVLEDDFLTCDVDDPMFAEVSVVICEPPNSGTAIMDKLGYLLQEEEFPNDQYSHQDLLALKRRQLAYLSQAFSFPKVTSVVYMTRSIHPEENEQIVSHVMDRITVAKLTGNVAVKSGISPNPFSTAKGVWELTCVLPEIVIERQHEYEYEECLKIRPTEEGNGVFIAHFHRELSVPKPPEETPAADAEAENTETTAEMADQEPDSAAATEHAKKLKKSRRRRKQREGVTGANDSENDAEAEEDSTAEGEAAAAAEGSGRNSLASNKDAEKRLSSASRKKKLTKSQIKLFKRLARPRFIDGVRNEGADSSTSTSSSSDEEGGSRRKHTPSHHHSDANDSDSGNETHASSRNADKKKKKKKRRSKRRQQRLSSAKKEVEEEVEDLSVFGIGLKRFYAPHFAAMKALRARAAAVEDLGGDSSGVSKVAPVVDLRRREDEQTALAIAEALTVRGLNVTKSAANASENASENRTAAGTSTQAPVSEQIESAQVFCPVLTKAYETSHKCVAQLHLAVQLLIPILPIRLQVHTQSKSTSATLNNTCDLITSGLQSYNLIPLELGDSSSTSTWSNNMDQLAELIRRTASKRNDSEEDRKERTWTRTSAPPTSDNVNDPETELAKLKTWLNPFEMDGTIKDLEARRHPGTHEWLLKQILEWMRLPEDRENVANPERERKPKGYPPSNVLFIHGEAGSGKSVIAAYLCQHLSQQTLSTTTPLTDAGTAHTIPSSLSVAHVLFSANRGDWNDSSRFIRTLAHQLAANPNNKAYSTHLLEILSTSPNLFQQKGVLLQARMLLVDPLQKTKLGRAPTPNPTPTPTLCSPVVIVVDGLDECEATCRREVFAVLEEVVENLKGLVRLTIFGRKTVLEGSALKELVGVHEIQLDEGSAHLQDLVHFTRDLLKDLESASISDVSLEKLPTTHNINRDDLAS